MDAPVVERLAVVLDVVERVPHRPLQPLELPCAQLVDRPALGLVVQVRARLDEGELHLLSPC